jgi:hypothetical protein
MIQIGITSYGVLGKDGYQYPTMDLVGEDKWAIRNMKTRLTRRGDWIYEPMPSSRTNQFFKRTQMTHDEAMEKYKKILETWSIYQAK